MYNAYLPKSAKAVTPSDSAQVFFNGFYVGGAGNVAVVTEAGDATTFVGVPTGATIMCRVAQIMATGTTATNIVGLL